MIRYVFAAFILCLPVGVAAQATATPPGKTTAIVRSADTTQVVTMRVSLDGRLFASLGPAVGSSGQRNGRVSLEGDGGVVTTPAELGVSDNVGWVEFAAPTGGPDLEMEVTGPGVSLRARGRVVRIVRNGGTLQVEAKQPSGK